MKLVNLTIPLYPHMPVGNVWAWDVPFQEEEITVYNQQACRLTKITMHSEAGTRLMTDGVHNPDHPTVEQLPLDRYWRREAVVIDIPKGEYANIEPEDIERTLAVDPDYRQGDVVIIRTGWSNGERFRHIGDDYARKTPHFSHAGAEAAVKVMKAKGTDLMLTDCAYIGNCGEAHMRKEWGELPAWQRPAFPSPQAKAYLRTYTREMHWADWGSSIILLRAVDVVGAMGYADLLTSKRCRISVIPLRIENHAGATCTVMAELDD